MKKILLIDAHALIHRTYHALPPLTSPDGRPVGAIYGLATMLLKVLRDEQPDYVVAAFDRPETTFRKEMFEDYKAHRPKADDELVSQIVEAYTLFEKFNITVMEQPGFEGDDILGTLAHMFAAPDMPVTILTGDLDMLQLVHDPIVSVLTLKRGVSDMVRYDEAQTIDRFGIRPDQLIDYKGLVGDTSDNIPGVPGVGAKTAETLLQEYDSLENIYAHLKDLKPQYIKKLEPHHEQALLSKELATIRTDLSLKCSLKDFTFNTQPGSELLEYFESLGFKSLIERLDNPETREEPRTSSASIDAKVIVVTDPDPLIHNSQALRSTHTKIAHTWKELLHVFMDNDIIVNPPLFDTHIAAWLLDPDERDQSWEHTTTRILGSSKPYTEDVLRFLYVELTHRLERHGLMYVFTEIEMPLIEPLAHMERWGISIDQKALTRLQKTLKNKVEKTKQEAHKLAGTEFNLNSPKQVGELLFETLGITYPKSKTKSGKYRTSEEVLLMVRDAHPVVQVILAFRTLSKMFSTYVEPLLEKTKHENRIHTSFLQTATGTGRLASEQPNLQNIPKGSEWAKPLRQCFVAEDGWTLVSFDYSQLELRLLAHLSGDPSMCAAFKEGKDIHALTAAKVLEIPQEEVTPEQRRLAKTLNFGIVYGMGARAFSQQSGLSQKESREFIDKYFADFSGVKTWQEHIIKKARSQGYVTNPNGRRRWVSGYNLDRVATNMPPQSLEADIMKLGIIAVHNTLTSKSWLDSEVRLVLSIHDELLCEIRDEALEQTIRPIRDILEGVVSLEVPLVVEVETGKRWGDMKPLDM